MENIKELFIEFEKRITDNFNKKIDQLAKSTNERFDNLESKVEQLSQDFTKHVEDNNKQFELINNKFEQLSQNFAKHVEDNNKIFKQINKRFDKIDVSIDFLYSRQVTSDELLSDKMNALAKSILDKQFLFEAEYGKKIDVMYDAILAELDKNLEKSEKIRILSSRIDKNDVSLFNHEKRFSILERKKIIIQKKRTYILFLREIIYGFSLQFNFIQTINQHLFS